MSDDDDDKIISIYSLDPAYNAERRKCYDAERRKCYDVFKKWIDSDSLPDSLVMITSENSSGVDDFTVYCYSGFERDSVQCNCNPMHKFVLMCEIGKSYFVQESLPPGK